MNGSEAEAVALMGKWHDWSGQLSAEPLGRGALYADGFFTSCQLIDGRVVLGAWHVARMIKSASVLKLQLPDRFEEDLRKLARRLGSGVLKLYVQRRFDEPGSAPNALSRRGYAPRTAQVQLVWQFFEQIGEISDQLIPVQPAVNAVLLCQRLSLVPDNLAGLKTVSRLDQVLAAAELSTHRQTLKEPDLEGITLDLKDLLCEGVSHNLCLLIEGEWVTPELNNSGIHGVLRAALLEHGLLGCAALEASALNRAQAAVLINSVRGLIPLKSVYAGGAQITLDAGAGGHLAELMRQNTAFMSAIL